MSDDLDEWIAAELARCASAAPGALHVADVDEHRRVLTLLQQHRAALRATSWKADGECWCPLGKHMDSHAWCMQARKVLAGEVQDG